jgi:short-subunit dehydrogenase
MDLKEKYGRTAMIAGASEGIGAAFAEYLAKEGIDLILIARRSQPLNQVADFLGNNYKVSVTCIKCDLSEENALLEIEGSLNGRDIDLLVYNAALSYIGPFIENTRENLSRAALVNMMTPMKMVHTFGAKMLAKGHGAIILMSSMAGLQGSGFLSVYAATKAFSRVFAESLWYEWKSKGVDIIACVAGATSTPGYINSQPGKTSLFAPRVLNPDEIPAECFRNLGRKPSFITGRGNRISSFFMQKLLPRKVAVTIMGNNTRKMYRLQ